MAIAKLLLVLVSLGARIYAAAPPNPLPPKEQLREQHGLECAVVHFTALGKIISLIWAIFEISVIFALSDYCTPSVANSLLHVFRVPISITSNPVTFTALSSTFLIGTLATFTGGLLRAHCFHVLGSQFTIQLSIRPAHTLVTTGVYSIVRHPSYTGTLMLAVGWQLLLLDIRPWFLCMCASYSTCHVTVTITSISLFATLFGVEYSTLLKRIDREDTMLENKFGEQWLQWAKKVPWRLFPGIY